MAKRLNPRPLLSDLRTTRRVPQPALASHRLLRAAKEVTGVPVFHYTNRVGKELFAQPATGDAPNDSFYEDGAIYSGPGDHARRNGLWHELCHALVASEAGGLELPNYGQDNFMETDSEIHSCEVEYWLGFVSGFYSYDYLCEKIGEYQFDTDFKVTLYNRKKPQGAKYDPQEVEAFLKQCRHNTLKIPQVAKLAEALGLESEAKISDRMKLFRKRFAANIAA